MAGLWPLRSEAGVYDVTITSADGQSKIVKLTVKDNKQSISASDYTTYVGAAKPTATDFKAFLLSPPHL
ncbi:hypothetical protein [Lacticaseibacillus paracasei]